MNVTEAFELGRRAAHGVRLCASSSRRAAEGFRHGPLSGQSREFLDYRDYQPGDDLRHIDWQAYGRSDRMLVKRFHQEASPHLDLLIDGSGSIIRPQPEKAVATFQTAGYLYESAMQAGFGVHIMIAEEEWRILNINQPLSSSFQGQGPLPPLPASSRSHGHLILISDFLWPIEPRNIMGDLVSSSHRMDLIQVLTEEETHPQCRGHLTLVDAEDGASWQHMINDAVIRRYRTALTDHNQRWHDCAAQLHATFHQLIVHGGSMSWDQLHRSGLVEVER